MPATRGSVRPILCIDLVFGFVVLLRFISDHSVIRLVPDLSPLGISLSLIPPMFRSNRIDGILSLIAVIAIDAWNDVAF